MGGEWSSLSVLFDIEEELAKSSKSGWTLHTALRQQDNTEVSMFIYDKSDINNLEFMENVEKHLKVLRHPSILRYISHNKAKEGWVLVTEKVHPLEMVLEHLTAVEICAGLYNIIEALAFLHERGEYSHNDVSVSSIFVADDGSWKLGGMECLCKFDQATAAYLNKCKSQRNADAIPPEEKSGPFNPDPKIGHARDAFAFGVLADQLLEHLVELGDMTKTFELRIQDEFLHVDPKARPQLKSLLEDRLFKNDYVEIVNFLKHLTLKSDKEKKYFFSQIVSKLYSLPVDVVASRLTHPLLARFVLLDATANECLMPHLLTPCKRERAEYVEGEMNPILPETLFKKYLLPQLYKIFHVRNASVRTILLQNFSAYVHLFDKEVLENVILPQVLLGVKDKNDNLVELSLGALANLVRLLGGDTVIGCHRARIFSEGKPKFGGNNIPTHSERISQMSSVKFNKRNEKETSPKRKDRETPQKTLKELAKEAERQQRREEARKRAEDRRKKREEIKHKPNTAKLIMNDEDGLVSGKEVETPKGDQTNEEKRLEETEWSDWNNKDHTSKHSSDEDIDEEIENELNAMDSTLSPEYRDKVRKSDETDSSPAKLDIEPVQIDWSDCLTSGIESNATSDRKGILKLKGLKSRSSPPPEEADKSDAEDQSWGQSEWRTHDTIGVNRHSNSNRNTTTNTVDKDDWGKDLENSQHDNQPSQGANKNLQKTAKLEPLGSEFDILALDIKTKKEPKVEKEEFDFFSDMAPVIEKKPSLLETLAATNATKGSTGSGITPNKPSLSFAVQEMDEMETTAWGNEDVEWGENDDWS